jgi:nucleotide-binding universal stress UspA family protein
VDEIRAYAEYLKDLLSASLDHVPREATIDTLAEKTRQDCDLVIMGRPENSLRGSLFSGALEMAALGRLSVSMLIAQQPCWPLHRLLLVIQGEASDEEATAWILRLAELSGASVTALAVVPPIPATYHGLKCMEGGLAELLATDTPLGREMRDMARRLVDRGIEGTLRLRQGSPEWEIRRELVRGQFDILVIGAAPRGGVQRWLVGDLAVSLTRVDRPILFAR